MGEEEKKAEEPKDAMFENRSIVELKMDIVSRNELIRNLQAALIQHNVTIQKHITENADSLEIGSQKLGRVKVYGDFAKGPEFESRLNEAIRLKQLVQEKVEKLEGGETGKNGGD